MAFTDIEYANAACDANNRGLMLYVLVSEDGDESLLIAPANYYVCEELNNRTDGTINPSYDEELLEDIMSIPVTRLYVDGEIKSQEVGLRTKEQLRDLLDETTNK